MEDTETRVKNALERLVRALEQIITQLSKTEKK